MACSSARARASASFGPLDGAIVSIKDLYDVAGEVTRAGSRVLADEGLVAVADAPVVKRLRAAGAVIVAKTNMSEFAFSGVGINPHYGTPRNPYDRATGRLPGGSSSGGASSRAITSPAGTADTMGALAEVALSPARLREVVAGMAQFAGEPVASLVTTDGVRVQLRSGGWGLIRASSNKPELVVVCESPVSEANRNAIFADIKQRFADEGADVKTGGVVPRREFQVFTMANAAS